MRRPIVTACLCLMAFTTASPAHAQLPRPTGCGPGIHAGEATGTVLLPQGDLFCPRVADPKEPRSFASLLRWRSPDHETTVGAVGIGDSFGIVRWGGPAQGDGFQLGVVGSVFAQFDLETESFDLINADYIIAVPLTFRRGGFSTRLRVYHQSSHLGDEYLLREEPERVNLAFESLELILSQELGPVRMYGGAEHLFNREPDDLEARVAHLGAELRAGSPGGIGVVAAVDMKSTEEQDWKPAWSARAGIEIGWGRDPAHPPRVWRILAEFYDGPAPYGQFYRDNIRFYGVGFQLSL